MISFRGEYILSCSHRDMATPLVFIFLKFVYYCIFVEGHQRGIINLGKFGLCPGDGVEIEDLTFVLLYYGIYQTS